jgi:hypothetical protein
MAAPGDTLGRPWPPLTMRPCYTSYDKHSFPSSARVRRDGGAAADGHTFSISIPSVIGDDRMNEE